MTLDLDTLRDTHPRVKQDVIFARTPSGVIFHNASTGFQIASRSAYDFAAKIVPHLNGDTRFGDLHDALPETHRALLVSLVGSLVERGFVRDAETDAEVPDGLDPAVLRHFAAQINYIDHYEDRARHRFLRLRTTPVAVLGTDTAARFAVLGLIRNGVAHVGVDAGLALDGPRSSSVTAELATLAAAGAPSEVVPHAAGDRPAWAQLDGYRYVIVAGGDAAVRTKALLDEGVPEGVSLLSAVAVGPRMLVGPMTTAGRGGCTVCALLRLGQNGDAAHTADVWAELAAGAPNPGPRVGSRSLAAMLGNLLGYEVFRAASGAMPAETRDTVLVQDLESTDVASDPLLPHPRCPRCAPLVATSGLDLASLRPETAPRVEPADVDRSEPQFDRAARHAVLLGAAGGVFTGYDDADFTQLPVRVGRVRLGLDHARRRAVTAFDVHTTIAARLRAVQSAAVAYALSLDGAGTERSVTEGRAVPLASCSLASVRTDAAVEDHVAATGLLTRSTLLLPAPVVWTHGARNAGGLAVRAAAGVGAGATASTALGAAVLSALTGDAVLAAAFGTPARPVDTSTLAGDPQLAYLVEAAAAAGIEFELLELATDRPESTLLARGVTATGGRPTPWAAAGALSWRDAAIDAITDLLGQAQVAREHDGEGPDVGEPLLEALDPAVIDAGPTGPQPARLTRTTTWDDLLARVGADGRELAVVDLGPADLARGGVRVLRAVLVDEGR